MQKGKSGKVIQTRQQGAHRIGTGRIAGDGLGQTFSWVDRMFRPPFSNNRLEAKIGTPVEYAIWLEEGTSRMAARPLWEPVEKDSLPTLNKILEAEIGKGRGSVTSTFGR
jgi:hypothetical protein